MPTAEQKAKLTQLIGKIDVHKQLAKLDADKSTHATTIRHERTIELMEEMCLHLKQLQLEVDRQCRTSSS